MKEQAIPSLRIDSWLWRARFFKTRTQAAEFISKGNVRLTRNENTSRVTKPSAVVNPGDIVTFSRRDHLRIIEIKACPTRRGPASEAQLLYNDQSPPIEPKSEKAPAPFTREKGAGRPTKKDRRALQAIIQNQ